MKLVNTLMIPGLVCVADWALKCHIIYSFVLLFFIFLFYLFVFCLLRSVPWGSSFLGGDVMVYVTDINQPSLPTPFYSVLVSVFVFMALSTLFHSINSPDNSSLSHSVLMILILP